MEIKFIATLVIALLNIILGLVILKKNPKNPSNFNYSGLCLSGGLWAVSIALLFVVKDIGIFEWVIKANYFFGILAPLFYVIFSYHFPYKRHVYSRKILYTIYSIPLIQIILVLFNVLKMEKVVTDSNFISSNIVLNDFLIFTVYFFAYVFLGFFMLLKKYFTTEGIHKILISYIIIGTISTFLVTSIFSVIFLLFNNLNYQWLGACFLLVHFFVIGYFLFIKSR